MNEHDINKKTRGIAFWREDLLKYNEQRALNPAFKLPPLSQFIRDSLHERMKVHTLSAAGKRLLALEISNAIEYRKQRRKSPRAGKQDGKVLTVDAIAGKPPRPKFIRVSAGGKPVKGKGRR